MFLFPVHGLPAIEMREVQIVGTQLRLDREWGLFDRKKKTVLANNNSTSLLKFNLEFDDADTLIISHPDSEEDLVIDVSDHPQNRPGAQRMTLYGSKEGFSEGEKAS